MLQKLQKHIHKVEEKAKTIDAFLDWCEILDSADAEAKRKINELGIRRSPIREEHAFRQCAVITQLYSTYETFVEAALAFWLSKMPLYFQSVPDGLKNKYRLGISKIIRDIDRRQYRHLELSDVLTKFLKSVNPDSEWSFVTDALTMHENNLRRTELEGLFNTATYDSFWHDLENNLSHIYKSLENHLEDFVNYRNEAAHGSPDELISLGALRDWIEFVVIVCKSIADIITLKILHLEKEKHPDCILGEVIHKYSGNISIVKCVRGSLYIGQQIFFVKEKSYVSTEVLSLQLDEIDISRIEVKNESEVGGRTKGEVKKESKRIKSGAEVGIRTKDEVKRESKLLIFKDQPLK